MNAELQSLCLSFRERAFLLPRFCFIPHPFVLARLIGLEVNLTYFGQPQNFPLFARSSLSRSKSAN
jgi:hypothetical protein